MLMLIMMLILGHDDDGDALEARKSSRYGARIAVLSKWPRQVHPEPVCWQQSAAFRSKQSEM